MAVKGNENEPQKEYTPLCELYFPLEED